MLSVSPGHSIGYLTGQVAQGRENYYTDAVTAGEPPGEWWGPGAAALGLEGEANNDVVDAVYRFLDPRDPHFADPATRELSAHLGRAPARYRTADEIFAERIAKEPDALPERVREIRREAERTSRQAVAFLDATFSPAKSVTLIHTAFTRCELDEAKAGDNQASEQWRSRREAVEDAVMAGARASLTELNHRAGYSRVGRHGAGADRWIGGHGLVGTLFFQHDSRAGDPQLHVHGPISNRALCDDGQWRTLDSRAIHREKQAAGAIGERVMEEMLTQSLGVQWERREDGAGREIVGVDQADMALISERSNVINSRLEKEVDRFRQRRGREPSAFEYNRMSQHVKLATRPAKSHDGRTREELNDEADRRSWRVMGYGLHSIGERFAKLAKPEPESFSPSGLIAEAIAEVQEKMPAVTAPYVVRQITERLPTLGIPVEQIPGFVHSLEAEAIRQLEQIAGHDTTGPVPAVFQLDSGRSVYDAPAGRRYVTRGHLLAEQSLRKAAVERGRLAVDQGAVAQWMSTAAPAQMLGTDQAAAVRGLLTSGARVSVLIGPAGTGKSFTVGAFSEAWHDLTGGRVIGLATSQIAAEVLAGDGVASMNIARWLAAQERIATGAAVAEDRRWQLTGRDVVVIDEASMVDTTAIERIRSHVDRAGGRTVLAGDPSQLGAIGAGGAMMMLADDAIDTHRLAEVRRFDRPWEARASLRLRDGDPAALEEYDRHGRILDGGTGDQANEAAARAYVGDVLSGRTSLVVAATNDRAATISSAIREQLVQLGRVDAAGVALRDHTTAGVGDVVQARLNNWSAGLVNRRLYTVREVRDNGDLIGEAADGSGVRIIPASYAAEHATLGYASTVHSAQGLTTDTCHVVTSGDMDRRSLYVAMTRGRQANTAHVATVADSRGDTGEPRTAYATLADPLDAELEDDRAAIVQAAESAAADLSMYNRLAVYQDSVRQATRQRTDAQLDRLAAEGVLASGDRRALAADDGTETLSRLLRAAELAGHDPDTVLAEAVTERPMTGVRSPAQVLYHRISEAYQGQLTPRAGTMAENVPTDVPDDLRAWLEHHADRCDDRRRQLGAEVAAQAPQWAVRSFGPVPTDVVERAEWEHRAERVAAYREASRYDDQDDAIGLAPAVTSTERRAAWHDAWGALGRPETTSEERELSDGQLRNRVRAWETAKAWAPPDTFAIQQHVGQAAERHRQEAARLAEQAKTTADQAEAARLCEEASETAALAEVLAEDAAQLDDAADIRAEWRVRTAAIEELRNRALSEANDRGLSIGDEPDRVTAAEWLAEHDREKVAEDPLRVVTEADIREDTDDDKTMVDMSAEVASDDDTQADTNDDKKADIVTAEASPAVDADVDKGSADMSSERAALSHTDVDSDEDRLSPLEYVPSQVEVDVMVTAAEKAERRIADERSAEAAHAQWEASQQAEAEAAARQQAWRDRDVAEAAEAEVVEQDDAMVW